MQFFDQKEEVLDIQLTEHGRRLFSQGKFMPKYYSFSDEGIIYNLNNVGSTEEQNDANTRIVEETPYLKIIPRNTQVKDIGNFNDTSSDTIKENLTQATIMNSTVSRVYSLGNMSYSGSAAPKIKINVLEGNVTSVSGAYVPNTNLSEYEKVPLIPIPQIDVELVYLSTVLDREYPKSVFFSNFSSILNENLLLRNQNGALIGSSTNPVQVFDEQLVGRDGSVIKTYNPSLTLLLEEENTDNSFDNFELEIYEISDEINDLTGEKHLRKLLFSKHTYDLETKNGLLQSEEETTSIINRIETEYNREFSIAANGGSVYDKGQPIDVSYYLEVASDNYDEISEDLICSIVQQIKSNSFKLDIDYDCKSPTGVMIAKNDIYEKVIPDNTNC